jgi:hypothetical protein
MAIWQRKHFWTSSSSCGTKLGVRHSSGRDVLPRETGPLGAFTSAEWGGKRGKGCVTDMEEGEARHDEIHLFGGLYCKLYIGFDMICFAMSARRDCGSQRPRFIY